MEEKFEQHNALLNDPDMKLKQEVENWIQSEEERKGLSVHLGHSRRLESIDTIAGGVAHNLNNLLMGILGRVSLMISQMDSSHPLQEHVLGIETCVYNAVDLINHLMACTNREEYHTKPVELNPLIEKTAENFGRGKEELRLFKMFDVNLWMVKCDQDHVEQALLELLSNASQAMPDGGDLFIQTKNVVLDETSAMQHSAEPGPYVKISIADTGVGMNQDTLKRIFDPFFSTKTIRRGTGLGLSMVYGIIKNHGGFINAYSDIGEGSIFTIYLPAME